MLLEDLNVYRLAMEIGEETWKIVIGWDFFARNTLGKQLITCVDSIAANISEGFGRFHFKDSKNFYYYARGSISESKTWLRKAYSRKLINEDQYKLLIQKLDHAQAMLNSFIQSTGKIKS